MGSTTIQAGFGEDTYPIGRLLLERARALGMSRTELVLGYRQIGNGHRALSELLPTGKIPPLIARHLADALQVDEGLLVSVMAATDRQQKGEASQRTLARETAYRIAFRPHLRSETERTIPEPLYVAALLTSARLRRVPVYPETWHMSADERDRQLKAAIQEHYRKHAGHVPAFGAIVGYTAVVMAGYRLDFGLPYDLEGDPAGPMQPVERLHEAALGTERWDFAADRAFPRYVDPDPDVNLIEADSKTLPEESRQFAPLNIPPEATGAAARRATKSPAEGFRPSG